MSLQTLIGLWICRSVCLIFGLLEVRGCYIHLTTETWSPHAQFHALTGMFFYVGLSIAFFHITGKPFRERQWSAWLALPLMGFFVHGGQIITDALTEGLRAGGTSQGKGHLFFYLAILAFVLYLIGSVMTLSHFKNKDE